MTTLLRRLWAIVVASVERSGRSLRPTTSGKWVLGLALAVGFAAMNTGNNLLFFGWGLVLSGIVISGILSESTLQSATATLLPPDELRAGERSVVPVQLHNTRRLPAFGVGVRLLVSTPTQGRATVVTSGSTFELRLSPHTTRLAKVPLTPSVRGQLQLQSVRVSTAAPFGFFTKERIVDAARLPSALRTLLVLPERVDTSALGQALWARLGVLPAGSAGNGDELFSLRPFRDGDDPRRIAWKRAAKTGRLVVRENEATRSRELLVELCVGADASFDLVEDAVATAASLIEDLIADGHCVGLLAPGVHVPAARSPRQRDACLRALAVWQRNDVVSAAARGAAGIIAIAAGTVATEHADVVVAPLQRRSHR